MGEKFARQVEMHRRTRRRPHPNGRLDALSINLLTHPSDSLCFLVAVREIPCQRKFRWQVELIPDSEKNVSIRLGVAAIWEHSDSDGWECVATLEGHENEVLFSVFVKELETHHPTQVKCIAWSPDGKLIATCRLRNI